jgi:bifunctional non-homologous end joining protein LigD
MKGLQMYVLLNALGATYQHTANFVLAVGQVMERQITGALGMTTVMAKAARPGKIFVDWCQNAHHKTTIAHTRCVPVTRPPSRRQ